MRKILVTAALPYANGPVHLGHMLEHIQTDIWVRFQKLQGNNCVFVCGDDAHGTPIMIAARKLGVTPEELIAETKKSHESDFSGFNIAFDNYYTTHSSENRELAEMIYNRLKANGDIMTETIEQAYDPEAKMFLPDRFIKGTCPKCKTPDQYGDNCEACGATYSTSDLIDPISTVSGSVPIKKSSEHLFFRLSNYEQMLKDWGKKSLQSEIANKLNEWFVVGLKPWDISRDEPYFGFAIPDSPGKYFYVWLDAPIGYIASFKNLCEKTNLNFSEYWEKESETELYHFLGKDIIYFHALFWPAMLEGAKLRTPTKIFTHGYLTINGEKMSKSRGTFVLAKDYLEHLNPEYLRYYLAAKSNNSIDDIDLNFDDFSKRVNSDLVGKVVNIASRCAGFINKNFAGKLAAKLDNEKLFSELSSQAKVIAELYEKRDYNNAIRHIMVLADRANQYIDEKKPWSLAKLNQQDPEVQNICTMGINLFRLLIIYLKPVLPKMAADSEEFLNINSLTWNDHQKPLLDHKLAEFEPLMQRVDPEKIAKLLAQKN